MITFPPKQNIVIVPDPVAEERFRQKVCKEAFIKVMFDYSSSGLWLKGGTNVDGEDLPLSQELRDKVEYWVRGYDSAISKLDNLTYYLENNEATEALETAQQKLTEACEYYFWLGVERAIEIKKELPHWCVVVYVEAEYFNLLGLPYYDTERRTCEIPLDYHLPWAAERTFL